MVLIQNKTNIFIMKYEDFKFDQKTSDLSEQNKKNIRKKFKKAHESQTMSTSIFVFWETENDSFEGGVTDRRFILKNGFRSEFVYDIKLNKFYTIDEFNKLK